MSHYFESPSGSEVRREVRASIWGRDHTLTTANAVFSATRLDLGTAVLLREAEPDPASRRLLDLGCGYGPIAVALASECPDARVDAVDVNERALELTRVNAERAGVGKRVRATLPEQADPDARYDEIWSNPPIRIGKQALHELLLSWLPRLADGGVARLVVGKNLGADSLQRWLAEQGWECERLASAKGFRVFEVRRPLRGSVGGDTEEGVPMSTVIATPASPGSPISPSSPQRPISPDSPESPADQALLREDEWGDIVDEEGVIVEDVQDRIEDAIDEIEHKF